MSNWKEEFEQLKNQEDITFVTEKMRVKMGDVAIEDMFEVIEQFISDLRKRDEEELIKMLPKKSLGHINQDGFCDTCHFKICRCAQINELIDYFIRRVKDYYAK